MTEMEQREVTIMRWVRDFLIMPKEARELTAEYMRTVLALHDAGVTWDDLLAGKVVLDKPEG